jgi:hypothetical protein
MKTTSKLLAMTVLVLSVQVAQAHVTEDATHVHEGSQMRSAIQSMSPTDRLSFRDTMQTSLDGLPVEDRQAFRDNMRLENGMSTEDRQAFRDSMRLENGTGQGGQHMYGGGSQGMGQGGMGGGGYGRGFGRR